MYVSGDLQAVVKCVEHRLTQPAQVFGLDKLVWKLRQSLHIRTFLIQLSTEFFPGEVPAGIELSDFLEDPSDVGGPALFQMGQIVERTTIPISRW